ncbi:MAG TPA: hypothetical protein VGG57_17645 [Stellaceae bacterium]
MSVLENTRIERAKRLRDHSASLRRMVDQSKYGATDLAELADELERRAEAIERPISEAPLPLAG